MTEWRVADLPADRFALLSISVDRCEGRVEALKPRRSKHRSGQPMGEVKRTSRATAAILLGLLAAPATMKGLSQEQSPRPVSQVIAVLAELAQTHPGEAWRVDTERYRGKGPEPTALLLPRGGGPGRWFGGEPGNRVVASPVNDIVWDGNRVTATVGQGPTAKIEGLLQEDGSLLLDLSATGGGAEVRGTPAENETPRTLPNG